MLTSATVVGTVKQITYGSSARGYAMAKMLIACDRGYHSSEGNPIIDMVPVICWKTIADEANVLAKEGSVIAIRGRIQGNSYEKNGETYYTPEIVAERISYVPRH